MGQREIKASYGQRLLWLLQRSVGESGALNCPMIVRVRGPLDRIALGVALDRLVARHEALRTTFTGTAYRLGQVIHDPAPTAPPAAVDLRDCDDPPAEAHRLLAAELGTHMDFRSWPTRTALWRVGDLDHILCLNMHHLVTDAYSCGLLYRELADILAAPGRPMSPPTWQYADFTAAQDAFIAGSASAADRTFWTGRLTGMTLPEVPLAPRPADRRRTTATARRQIDATATRALRDLARAKRTTLFAVMLGVYYATLAGHTGQDDLAVTSLFANRGRREAAGTVGFLANMVVLRARLPRNATFEDVVDVAAGTARDAFVHQRLPYQLLPIESGNAGGRRVEDVVFQMLGEPIDVSTDAGAVRLSGLVPRGVPRFDLELALIPHRDGLQITLFYAADRLDSAWAETFVDDYANLAAHAGTHPREPVAAFPVGLTEGVI